MPNEPFKQLIYAIAFFVQSVRSLFKPETQIDGNFSINGGCKFQLSKIKPANCFRN